MSERKLNRSESVILLGLALLDVVVAGYFWVSTGPKPYIAVFTVTAGIWLVGIYLGFKRGVMFGRGLVLNRDGSRTKFYLNMALLILFHLCVVGFFIGIFLQQIGYLPRN